MNSKPKRRSPRKIRHGYTMERWFEEFGGEWMRKAVWGYIKKSGLPYAESTFLDFKDAAVMGLLEAWHKYEPDRGMQPHSFAAAKMNWSMMNHNYKHTDKGKMNAYHIPIHLRLEISNLQRKKFKQLEQGEEAMTWKQIVVEVSKKHGTIRNGSEKSTSQYHAALASVMAGWTSADDLVYEDDEMRIVDGLPSDVKSPVEEAETGRLFDKVMDFMRRHYSEADIKLLLKFIADPDRTLTHTAARMKHSNYFAKKTIRDKCEGMLAEMRQVLA